MADLPQPCVPSFLKARQDVVIPTPPFDLDTSPLPSHFFSHSIKKAWKEAETSLSLFIAHGLSLHSLRRVLGAYFTNVHDLTATELIQYAPYTILAVRQLISGSLIDIQAPSQNSLITRNSIGLLLRVPLECLYVMSRTDANVPQEKEGITQQAFRHLLCHWNATTQGIVPTPLLPLPP